MKKVDLKEYWEEASPEEKARLINNLMTNRSSLSQVCHGLRKPSKRFVMLLQQEIGCDELILPEIREHKMRA